MFDPGLALTIAVGIALGEGMWAGLQGLSRMIVKQLQRDLKGDTDA